MTAALRTEALSVRYGGVHALTDVEISIEPGQLVGLIGPNGAGKTTFIDALAGFAPASGSVWLGDRPLDHLPPHQRARSGLARTWQSSMLFDDLTVEENLAVASSSTAWWRAAAAVVRGRSRSRSVSNAVLRQLGIEFLAGASATSLTQGQRKLVGVARALASSPTVLCLDEPAAGLDTNESSALGSKLRSLAGGEIAILLVDHDMGLVLSICDLVVVLDFGRVIFQGPPDAVRSDPDVMRAYLGSTSVETPAPESGR